MWRKNKRTFIDKLCFKSIVSPWEIENRSIFGKLWAKFVIWPPEMAKNASPDQSLNVQDIIMKCVHLNVDVLISDVDIFWGGKTYVCPSTSLDVEQTASSASAASAVTESNNAPLTLFLAGADSPPHGGFSILSLKPSGLAIWNFVTLFKIYFRVLSQNLSKIGPAGVVLCGYRIWAERFRLELCGFLASFSFQYGSIAVNTLPW